MLALAPARHAPPPNAVHAYRRATLNAPFWAEITPADYESVVGAPLDPAAGPGPGWTLAAYGMLIATRRRLPMVGWVRGAFTLTGYPFRGGFYADLGHLPSGFRIGLFETLPAAAAGAAALLPVAPWDRLSAQDAAGLGDRTFNALANADFRAGVVGPEGYQQPLFTLATVGEA